MRYLALTLAVSSLSWASCVSEPAASATKQDTADVPSTSVPVRSSPLEDFICERDNEGEEVLLCKERNRNPGAELLPRELVAGARTLDNYGWSLGTSWEKCLGDRSHAGEYVLLNDAIHLGSPTKLFYSGTIVHPVCEAYRDALSSNIVTAFARRRLPSGDYRFPVFRSLDGDFRAGFPDELNIREGDVSSIVTLGYITLQYVER